MNDIVNRMISTQLLLFIYMLCGVIIRRAGIIRNDNRQGVVRLLMDVAMPMMVLSAFNNPVTANEMRSSLWIMAIALRPVVDGSPQSWEFDGNIDAPTLRPSINHVDCWHGWLTAGQFTAC